MNTTEFVAKIRVLVEKLTIASVIGVVALWMMFWRSDPKGIQFEPLLAHFDQLRLVDERQEEEDNDIISPN